MPRQFPSVTEQLAAQPSLYDRLMAGVLDDHRADVLRAGITFTHADLPVLDRMMVRIYDQERERWGGMFFGYPPVPHAVLP